MFASGSLVYVYTNTRVCRVLRCGQDEYEDRRVRVWRVSAGAPERKEWISTCATAQGGADPSRLGKEKKKKNKTDKKLKGEREKTT